MKKFLRVSAQKGFTLIELLIVIAILGIMSAALIASIDPLEQIKKSQDADLKEKAVEFFNANARYYTSKGAMPWATIATGGANCYSSGNTLSGVAISALTGCLTTLSSEGELKTSFSSATNLNQVFVSNPSAQTGSTSDNVVCFQPKSKSQQKDASTKYSITGATLTTCKSGGGSVDCYWCAF
ncbi:MAG: type II secretion system protein [Patescibacteria group bacterium]|mgnify:CR=1 FL=1